MTDDHRNEALEEAAAILAAELERADAEEVAELAALHRQLALNAVRRAGILLDAARVVLTEARNAAREAGEEAGEERLARAFREVVRAKVTASRALAGPVVWIPTAEQLPDTVPDEWRDDVGGLE